MIEAEIREEAMQVLQKTEELIAHLQSVCSSPAEAGLLLCSALQGIIIVVEGKPNNSVSLTDLTMIFLTLRREEELKKGTIQ